MLISAIGDHAMFFQHVGKHCISLHVRLETPWVRTQKAQMPMGADMVVDTYVMRPHIVTEWAIAAADIVHLPTIDGHMFVESDQTHHLPPILVSGQTVGILAGFIDHGKSQSSVSTGLQLTQLTGSQVGDVVVNIIIFTHITILIGFLDDLRVVLCCNIMHLMKSAARCHLVACTGCQGFNHLLSFGISRTGSDGHFLSLRRGLLWTSVLAIPRISGGSS